MKKLIGKIYKDEQGREIIERVTEPLIHSDWELLPFEEEHPYRKSLAYGYTKRCPYCGNEEKTWQETQKARDRSMNDAKYHSRNTYCGYCGHLMINKF